MIIGMIKDHPDVAERVDLYHPAGRAVVAQRRRCTTVRGRVAVVDLRAEAVIRAGNRLMVYALYPESVLVHMLWAGSGSDTILAVGRSTLDRSSTADIGALRVGPRSVRAMPYGRSALCCPD